MSNYKNMISIYVYESCDEIISISACKGGLEIEGYKSYCKAGHVDSNRIDTKGGDKAAITAEVLRILRRIEDKHKHIDDQDKMLITIIRDRRRPICLDTLIPALSNVANIRISDFNNKPIKPENIDYSNQGFVC